VRDSGSNQGEHCPAKEVESTSYTEEKDEVIRTKEKMKDLLSDELRIPGSSRHELPK